MFSPWLNTLHYSQTFNTAKLLVLNRLSEAPCDNVKFGGNWSYFTLYLTDKLTMTNFLLYLYPLTYRWALHLTLNIFSKVPHGQIKKVMNFTFWSDIHLNGLALFLHDVWWIEII